MTDTSKEMVESVVRILKGFSNHWAADVVEALARERDAALARAGAAAVEVRDRVVAKLTDIINTASDMLSEHCERYLDSDELDPERDSSASY